jgi:hypothetical protein
LNVHVGMGAGARHVAPTSVSQPIFRIPRPARSIPEYPGQVRSGARASTREIRHRRPSVLAAPAQR